MNKARKEDVTYNLIPDKDPSVRCQLCKHFQKVGSVFGSGTCTSVNGIIEAWANCELFEKKVSTNGETKTS